MTERQPPAPGYYPDPSGDAPYRFWDGAKWTTQVSSAPPGVTVPPAAPPPGVTAPPAAPPPGPATPSPTSGLNVDLASMYGDLGPRLAAVGRRRHPMELENVLGGLGGALVAAGAAILGVEASADDGGTALALVVPSIVVVIAAYLVVTKVSRHIAVMSAATAGVVIGLLGASAGLFGSDSDSAVWLLFFAIGCVAAYVSPVFFGRHGLLTAALLAMWGVIVTDGLGSAASWRNRWRSASSGCRP